MNPRPDLKARRCLIFFHAGPGKRIFAADHERFGNELTVWISNEPAAGLNLQK
ncbi:MAG: hypothetical protein WCS99_01260 [Limisphaerales bacterium]